MKSRRRRQRALAIPLAWGLSLPLLGHGALVSAQALPPAPAPDESFIVSNIRIEGLQRISEGTVFNYLPVNIGDRMTPQRLRESVRAIYATNFFRDVQLRRDGNDLIVVVIERPAIESF